MPVRWGVLGAAGIADRAVVPALRAAAGAEVLAVASRSAERGAAFAQRHGIPRVYDAYDALLADGDVDAVYVALPNDGHHPWTLAALAAGKAVLCEKPMALTAEQVHDITRASLACGLPAVEASMYRWHPRTRRIQELLLADAVGRVRRVESGFTFSGVPEGDYRLDPAKGGGAAYDVGCYIASAALWAFGSPARSVSAHAQWHSSGVDHTVDAVVTFDQGRAELHASIAEPERQWLTITGDRGRIEVPGPPFTAWLGMDTVVEVVPIEGSGGDVHRIAVPADDPYRLMVEDVSAAVADSRPALLSLAETLATAELLDGILAAARTGTDARLGSTP